MAIAYTAAGDLPPWSGFLNRLLTYIGGTTQTIALEEGSPAINAGDETVCAAPPVSNLDQRSFVRPGVGATKCSIGAYEYGSHPFCVGDCDSDGTVSVDEILALVNIGLGNTSISTCEAGDANHDGKITVDEILAAVNAALTGCPVPHAPVFVDNGDGTISESFSGSKSVPELMWEKRDRAGSLNDVHNLYL